MGIQCSVLDYVIKGTSICSIPNHGWKQTGSLYYVIILCSIHGFNHYWDLIVLYFVYVNWFLLKLVQFNLVLEVDHFLDWFYKLFEDIHVPEKNCVWTSQSDLFFFAEWTANNSSVIKHLHALLLCFIVIYLLGTFLIIR